MDDNYIILEAKRLLDNMDIPCNVDDLKMMYWDGMNADELVRLYRSTTKFRINESAKDILRPKRKSISKATRKAVWMRYDGRCAYCGHRIPLEQMEIDHIYPLSMGGIDDYRNYAPACHACNCYKSSMTVEGFRNKLESIQSLMKKDPLFELACSYGLITKEKNVVTFYFEQVEMNRQKSKE